MKTTVSFGTRIDEAAHLCTLIPLKELVRMIKKDPALKSETTAIRQAAEWGKEAYQYAKKRLPFFSMSHFREGIRKKENFLQAVGMILDIEYLPDSIDAATLLHNPYVTLGYQSPGGKGLKLVLLFNEPITQPELYKQLYLQTVADWEAQYHLTGCIDKVTHDVTRVSFLCHDENVWYHKGALTLKTSIVFSAKAGRQATIDLDNPQDDPQHLDDSVYDDILKELETRAKPKKPWQPREIPEPIAMHRDEILAALEEKSMRCTTEIPINWGWQVEIAHGEHKALINVYHGKRGYTVVITPRSDTHMKLAEAVKAIIESIVFREDDQSYPFALTVVS